MSNPTTPRRLHTSSSVLDALSSLTPPSPILSPSQLSSPWTSGDIPILFDSPTIDSIASLASVSDNLCSSRHNVAGLGLLSSFSVRTVETVGTFGPVRRNLDQTDSGGWSPTSQISGIRNSAATSPANIDFRVPAGPSVQCISSVGVPVISGSPSLASHEGYYNNKHSTIDLESRFTISAYLASPSCNNVSPMSSTNHSHRLQPSCGASSSSQSAHGSFAQDEFSGGLLSPAYDNYAQVLQSSQTFSTLPTPSFAPPSPSSSVDTTVSCPSSPRSRHRFRFPSGCHGLSEFPKNKDVSWMVLPEGPQRSITPLQEVSAALAAALEEPNFPYSAPSTPQIPNPHEPVPRRRSNVSNDAEYAQRLPLKPHTQQSSPSRNPKYAFLPKNLPWLKGMVVELLIDQEGFRTIRPSFKLIGYSSQTRSLDPHWNVMDGGVAEFMSSKRQRFHFHYAPFDGLPILRRITVNGEESRDYISRQASLSLKSNGVYTVRGTETSSLPASYSDGANSLTSSHGPDTFKLRWRFDYMVDDRRVEATGRIMDGEKTLTPLTFSCSPVLLHPLQGKKIRLIHIVKKSVATKLIAEKMEPPTLRRHNPPTPTPAPAAMPPLSILKTNIQTTTSHYLAKSHAWNLHRRAQSHVPTCDKDQVRLAGRPASRLGPRPTVPASSLKQTRYNGGDAENQMIMGHGRRRRASSAGERSLARRDLDGHSPLAQAVQSTDSCSPVFPPLAKHIVSRSHLSELLAVNMGITTPAVPSNTFGFEALSPRNYHGMRSGGLTRN